MIHPAGRTFHPSRHPSIYSNKSRSSRNSNNRSDGGRPQPFGCSNYRGAKLPFFFLFFWWVCFCGSSGGSADTTHRQRQRQTEERKRERRACVHKEKGVRPPAPHFYPICFGKCCSPFTCALSTGHTLVSTGKRGGKVD